MKQHKESRAILLMGGTGQRFGSCLPKQFHHLSGKKIYLHTLERFLFSDLFEEIILVCPKDWVSQVLSDTSGYSSQKISIIEGGKTRQESSLLGLLACPLGTQIVVIHDAVRPFVSEEILKNNIKAAVEFGAVDTCIPSADTLVSSLDGVQIEEIPLRNTLLRGQTPQSFSYPLILNAHRAANEAGVRNSSDDCALVVRLQHPVHITLGSETNLKITSETDLILAEQLLRLHPLPTSSIFPQETLCGKRFAITGGTGGIGTALTDILFEQGAIPILLSRSAPNFPVDLTSFSSTQETFQKIFAQYGPLDGLINCVGFLTVKPLHLLSQAEIDQLIATNLTSVIYSCHSAQIKPGGHIINLASSSYTRGRKNYAIYSSAKAAVVNFTQGLAEECPQLKINTIVPSRTKTSMRQHNFPNEDPSTLLTPGEVAKQIVFLLQTETITGSTIKIAPPG